jgi:hypothetical protein
MKRLGIIFLVLVSILLFLILAGRWRSTGVGPQVQVPMFYDAHYLFPRPWTQEQTAPGVPAPAPVAALYGPNRLTQSFTAGADRLSMLALWLAGPAGSQIELTLTLPDGQVVGGRVTLEEPEGEKIYLAFPPVQQAEGKTFALTLAAPAAEWGRPVIVRTVGGDRLASSIRLNEYYRPGNLELYTYVQGGLPGRWWSAAIGEQLLPDLFRLRLQQYKPPLFKGNLFVVLLVVMLLLTVIYLVWARPGRQTWGKAFLWAGILLIGPFVLWQLSAGRVLLPGLSRPVQLQPVAEAIPVTARPEAGQRLVHDLPLTLWTAERLPEERFVETALVEGWFVGEKRPAIHVPRASELHYPLVVPPEANLVYALHLEGEGSVKYQVRLGSELLQEKVVTAGEADEWVELTLFPYAGTDAPLEFAVEPVTGDPEIYWLQPQIFTRSAWLLPALPANINQAEYYFGDEISLSGYSLDPPEPRPGEPTTVTLYWQADRPVDRQATAFVHLLDRSGNITAQHDAQPVLNSYPLPVWVPGMTIADPHPLIWPETPAGELVLAAGLYDPVTFVRWPVTDAAGERQADDRAVLDGEEGQN